MAVSATPIAETSLCSCLFIGYLNIPTHPPARRVLQRKSTYFHSVFELGNKNISFCWLKLYSYFYIWFYHTLYASIFFQFHRDAYFFGWYMYIMYVKFQWNLSITCRSIRWILFRLKLVYAFYVHCWYIRCTVWINEQYNMWIWMTTE